MPPSLPALALFAGAALGAAGLGAALAARRAGLPHGAMGWAGASAAGLMLGVAYALVSAGMARGPWAAAGGAALACVALHLLRAERPVPQPAPGSPVATRDAVRASAVHSAAEGVAIGAASALGTRFGAVLALTLALHNVSEGALLGDALAAARRGPARAALVAILARAPQVVFALVTVALLVHRPDALPWALGAGFGALVYLLFAELLPESYRDVGRTGIAIVVCVASGIVALLGGSARGGVP